MCLNGGTKVIGLFIKYREITDVVRGVRGFWARTFDCCFLNPGVTSVMLDKVSPRVHTLVLLSASPYWVHADTMKAVSVRKMPK